MSSAPTGAQDDPYDMLGSAAGLRTVIWFGDLDVSSAVTKGQTKSQINAMASATFELDARSPILADVDFTSEVVISTGDRDSGRQFTGYVLEARIDGEAVRVQCESQPSLHDPMSGAVIARTHPVDTVYALLREAGLPESRMHLAGLQQLPTEVFEAVSSVNGLVLPARVSLGNVILLPAGSCARVASLLDQPESPYVKEFLESQSYAVTYVTASRIHDAEKAAIARLDEGLAWVNVRLRFAGAVTPAGRPVDWQRVQLRQLASRGQLIVLRGMLTNRCWLHQVAPPLMADLPLASGGDIAQSLATADPGLRGAVKAAARAMSSPDPSTRVTAVSECLEFYAGRTKADYDFTRAERRTLLDASQGFSPEKQRRVSEMIGALNTASLMRKLRVQLADDGVPITEGEMDSLWRVREQRNALVHGRTDAVDQADLQQAMALLARIVVYASDRSSGTGL